MKKIIFTGLLGIGMVFSAQAQLKVVATGQTQVRKDLLVGQEVANTDARIKVGFERTANGNAYIDLIADRNAYPAYGTRMIRLSNGETKFDHRGPHDFTFNTADGANWVYKIGGTERVRFTVGGIVPGADGVSDLGSAQLRFEDVYATNGMIQTSDRRSKKNIEDLNYGIEDIMMLKPVSFQWKDTEDESRKLGFIAQDVQEIISEVVKVTDVVYKNGTDTKRSEITNSRLGMYYADLLPVVVKAIQQQQEVIEEKDIRIAEMESRLKALEDKIANIVSVQNVDLQNVKSDAGIGQNRPNPFQNQTQIDYVVPTSASSAVMNVYDVTGKVIKSIPITHTGIGSISFKAGELSSGTYTYQLIVDEKLVDAKKMIKTQ